MSTSSKPACLDASLLFARKGEATPAIKATLYNNPGYAWGEALHPNDFQAEVYPLYPDRKPVEIEAEKVADFDTKKPDQTVPINTNVSLPVDAQLLLRLQYLAQETKLNLYDVADEALDMYLCKHGVFPHISLTLEPKR